MSKDTEDEFSLFLSRIFDKSRAEREGGGFDPFGGHFRMDPEDPVEEERYARQANKDRFAGLKEEFEEKRQSGRRSSSEILFDFYHGLTPGNGFIDMRGQGRRTNAYGPKQLTEAQMIRLIRVAVERYGWNNIWFHKNGVIDPDATNLANTLLATKLVGYREKLAAEGREIRIRNSVPGLIGFNPKR